MRIAISIPPDDKKILRKMKEENENEKKKKKKKKKKLSSESKSRAVNNQLCVNYKITRIHQKDRIIAEISKSVSRQ